MCILKISLVPECSKELRWGKTLLSRPFLVSTPFHSIVISNFVISNIFSGPFVRFRRRRRCRRRRRHRRRRRRRREIRRHPSRFFTEKKLMNKVVGKKFFFSRAGGWCCE